MSEMPVAGGAARAADPWLPLMPLMASYGVTIDAPAFYAAVNRAFHGCGAQSYDTLHRHMWQSMPDQFQQLVSDFLQQYPPPNHRMSALDVGCGTGLGAELLLQTRLGAFIRQIDLLDPAQEMLQICSTRHSLLTIRHRLICGNIESLPVMSRYDVIVASCVLQHVADLPEFLRQVASRQSAGGMFLHLQDPNADFDADPERLRRVEQFKRSRRGLMKRLSRKLRHHGKAPSAHVAAINGELLRLQIVDRPLSEADIAAVVRVRSHEGPGVSIRQMKALLPGYRLVSSRSWAFFGDLLSALPPEYRRRERALIAERAQNGCQIGAVWMKSGLAK